MKLNVRALSSLATIPCLMLATSAASAQTVTGGILAPGRVALEQYVTQYRLTGVGDERVGMSGIGGRLLWRLAVDGDGSSIVPQRAAVGLFAEYTSGRDGNMTMLHTGVQGDLELLDAPLWGRVEPIASLSAGGLRLRRSSGETAQPTPVSPGGSLFLTVERPVSTKSEWSVSVAPAAGVRVALFRRLGLRTDVRDVVTFRGGVRHHVSAATGLSFSF